MDSNARYRRSECRFLSSNELRVFLRDEVFPCMASLVREEPQVAIYFQDARLEVDDAQVLKQVVDELDGIQFGKLGSDGKGDIYEYLLAKYSDHIQKKSPQELDPKINRSFNLIQSSRTS